MSLLIYLTMMALVVTFGTFYPAVEPGFNPTFIVDLLVVFFFALMIGRSATLLHKSIRFRLDLRRAMKEAAQ